MFELAGRLCEVHCWLLFRPGISVSQAWSLELRFVDCLCCLPLQLKDYNSLCKCSMLLLFVSTVVLVAKLGDFMMCRCYCLLTFHRPNFCTRVLACPTDCAEPRPLQSGLRRHELLENQRKLLCCRNTWPRRCIAAN